MYFHRTVSLVVWCYSSSFRQENPTSSELRNPCLCARSVNCAAAFPVGFITHFANSVTHKFGRVYPPREVSLSWLTVQILIIWRCPISSRTTACSASAPGVLLYGHPYLSWRIVVALTVDVSEALSSLQGSLKNVLSLSLLTSSPCSLRSHLRYTFTPFWECVVVDWKTFLI